MYAIKPKINKYTIVHVHERLLTWRTRPIKKNTYFIKHFLLAADEKRKLSASSHQAIPKRKHVVLVTYAHSLNLATSGVKYPAVQNIIHLTANI